MVPDMAIYKAWVALGRAALKSATVRHYYFDGRSPPGPADDEPSMWEPYDAPVIRLTAEALGYGDGFAFAERSPTNAAHADFAKNKNEGVRSVAAFVSAADVENVDGRTVTTRISGGEIDFEEFLQMMTAKMSDSDTREEIEKVFKMFDTSGKGKIEFIDFKRICKELGYDKKMKKKEGQGAARKDLTRR